jgi:hypothetical protein
MISNILPKAASFIFASIVLHSPKFHILSFASFLGIYNKLSSFRKFFDDINKSVIRVFFCHKNIHFELITVERRTKEPFI